MLRMVADFIRRKTGLVPSRFALPAQVGRQQVNQWRGLAAQ